jgi:hypothetical protein
VYIAIRITKLEAFCAYVEVFLPSPIIIIHPSDLLCHQFSAPAASARLLSSTISSALLQP